MTCAGEVRLCFLNVLSLCFAEEYAVDEELVKPVDIGFPALRLTRAEQIAIKAEHFKQQKSNESLEKLARTKQCKSII